MTQLELEKVLEICNKATDAPWISYVEGRDFESGSSFIMTGGTENRDYDIEFIKIRPSDQDFIAMARNVMPMIIEELIKLKYSKE